MSEDFDCPLVPIHNTCFAGETYSESHLLFSTITSFSTTYYDKQPTVFATAVHKRRSFYRAMYSANDKYPAWFLSLLWAY